MIKQRTAGKFKLITESRIDLEEYFDKLIVPGTKAPVIVDHDGVIDVTPMRFSLIPSWSKEPKVKFATHNARLESIDEKPTWRGVFGKKHCLVPLTDFIEPIYDGEFAGYMVAFHAQTGDVLYAAGVWDDWVNRETGEVIQSFAIITHDPPEFIQQIGHDRCPVFLDEEAGQEWLQSVGTPSPRLKEFLLQHPAHLNLAVDKHRQMKPGWEKRK